MFEIAESINRILNDFANSASCDGCMWLEAATMNNPNYCRRIDDFDEAVAACTMQFCPYHISLDQVKQMQEDYKQLRDKVSWYERYENLRNYGGRG